jgi:hypothetical protein
LLQRVVRRLGHEIRFVAAGGDQTNSVAVCTKDFGLAKAWALFSPRGTTIAGPSQATFRLSVNDFAVRLDAELREELLRSLD